MSFTTNRDVTSLCSYHVVFRPKYHRKVLDKAVAARLQGLIRDLCEANWAPIIKSKVGPDYVHLLLRCEPQLGVNRLIRLIKGTRLGCSAVSSLP